MALKSIISILCAMVFIGATQATEVPAEAKRLVEQRSEAIQKIDAKFCEELEKIKMTYTKRGDLDAANAIAALINTVASKSQIPRKILPKDVIEGVWKRDYDGSIWIFDGKGGGLYEKGVKLTVSYDHEKKHFRLKSAQWTNTVSYGSDLNGTGLSPISLKIVRRKAGRRTV